MWCDIGLTAQPIPVGENRIIVPHGWQSQNGDLDTGTLVGVITDSVSQRPLPGAIVRVDSTKLGAITNLDGRFAVNGIPDGIYSISISDVGYKEKHFPSVQIVRNSITFLRVSMVAERW